MRPSSLCSYPCKALAFLQISVGVAWGFSSIQAINCFRRSPSRTISEMLTAVSRSTLASFSFLPSSMIGSILISLSNFTVMYVQLIIIYRIINNHISVYHIKLIFFRRGPYSARTTIGIDLT